MFRFRIATALALCVVLAATACADPTSQINAHVKAAWDNDGVTPASTCSDRVFVRRVYLDLAGRVPTAAEVDTFLKDQRKEKREALVDLLLGSEDYAQHFADLFDALLMGRAEEKKYTQRVGSGWRGYLESVFRENRPWNRVAREILLARPESKERNGAVWFLYERNNEHQAIAEAVAPAFFGIRIECAQCHDHMMVDEIRQEHYWGLVAFFNRGKNKQTKQGPRVTESAIGGFSEFANLEGDSTPNHLVFLGAERVDEPRPAKDEKQEDAKELYVNASTEGDLREPKFSRRKKFVTQVLDGHPLLARAMVNRVWAIIMGRGIVHPFDEIDSMHPPSHGELLDWLSEDFAASGFDIRRLVRSIVLCDAYALDSVRIDGATAPESFAWYLERSLTAEQLARSIQLVLRGEFRNDHPLISPIRQQLTDVLPDQIEVGIADALFLSNGAALQDFIRDSNQDGHLLRRVDGMPDDEAARVMIQKIFHRDADEEEVAAITAYLSKREDKAEALQQVAWSLITSAEFRFNH